MEHEGETRDASLVVSGQAAAMMEPLKTVALVDLVQALRMAKFRFRAQASRV